MAIIEKFTDEELKQLIVELKESGYEVQESGKGALLRKEAEKIGLKNAYISTEIRKPIFDIADWATENTTQKAAEGKPLKTYKNKFVEADKKEEYCRIISGILVLLKPYYGRLGFRQRQNAPGSIETVR